jgi:hypothetical protein
MGRHVAQLAREAEWEDQSIYIQVTRGPMAVRNHAFPKQVAPTVVRARRADDHAAGQPARAGHRRRVRRRHPLAALRPQDHLAAGQLPAAADGGVRRLRRDRAVPRRLPHRGFRLVDLRHQGWRAAGADQEPPDAARHHLRRRPRTRRQHGLPHQVRDITEAETRAPTNSGCAPRPRKCCPSSRSTAGLASRRSRYGGTAFAQMYAWYQEFKATVMRATSAIRRAAPRVVQTGQGA